MKILVTGATGFLGKVLVQKLLEQGEKDIRCIVRDKRKCAPLEQSALGYSDAGVEFLTGNLLSSGDVSEAMKDVNIVFHLASMLRASSSSMFLNNVVGSRNLMEAAIQFKSIKKFILISSIAIYRTHDLPNGATVNEDIPIDDCPEKRDVYTHSKLMQEELFWKNFNRFEFDFAVARPSVIYGPGGTALPARVGLQLPGLFLHLGGSNRIPITYVDNCVEALALIARHENTSGQIYNIVDDDLPTSRYYLKQYRRIVGRIRYIWIPYPMLMMLSRLNESYSRFSKGQLPAVFTPYKSSSMWKRLFYDNSKIKQLGWEPRVPTEEAMKITFQTERQSLAEAELRHK
ncbi:MAG: NAD-dependent epimerase/dehydratase family protein [Candidatus Latescibacteria bacterium]|nr:NAD-dependent epimerase/dehydratase family protein [Candidatus Latescibacterota bacterium]NIM21493.1 NAD-dependent epimerase/dehydratase family protein [Candidatus Latescibacterota bacterium]NIM65664.1 NAD-dependent epimerase/dehydratase family protein [Candidatus Latescibacterota bacterium]NIO02046.1 NAD-dependent epimerase/dehydratase family protein [Candidatus Latescibacterota bacterium]NIO28858.1 NAD-dependent epimerase/dehydratase family protein [Candidatus Latescibacterota bacterium]